MSGRRSGRGQPAAQRERLPPVVGITAQPTARLRVGDKVLVMVGQRKLKATIESDEFRFDEIRYRLRFGIRGVDSYSSEELADVLVQVNGTDVNGASLALAPVMLSTAARADVRRSRRQTSFKSGARSSTTGLPALSSPLRSLATPDTSGAWRTSHRPTPRPVSTTTSWN